MFNMYFIADVVSIKILTLTVDKTQASRWNWYPPHLPVCGVEQQVTQVFTSLTFSQNYFQGLCLLVELGRGVSQQYLYCYPSPRCVDTKNTKNYKKIIKLTKKSKNIYLSRPCQACEPCLKSPNSSSAKVIYIKEMNMKNEVMNEGMMMDMEKVVMNKVMDVGKTVVDLVMMMENLEIDWNWMMRMVNGNKLNWIDVLYQNIPLGLSSSNKECIINQIMHSFKPHLLGVAEPRYSELETLEVPGYKLIKGWDGC